MEWYALYIDGQLQVVRKWYGTPTVRDMGVAECPNVTYNILKVPVYKNEMVIEENAYI